MDLEFGDGHSTQQVDWMVRLAPDQSQTPLKVNLRCRACFAVRSGKEERMRAMDEQPLGYPFLSHFVLMSSILDLSTHRSCPGRSAFQRLATNHTIQHAKYP